MKTLNIILLLSAFFAFMACNKNENFGVNEDDQLIGCWINPVYIDSTVTYEKATTLKENDYGFQFKTENLFVERKNSGWCGTPPIAYADFDGTWNRNDSIININVDYWGGTVDCEMKIISSDQQNLSIYKINEVYHLEGE